MSRRARASGVGGGKKPKLGLWSLVRRMFGAPRGRHDIGPAPAITPAPAAERAVQVTPEVATPDSTPQGPAPVVWASLPAAPVPSGLAFGLTSIRLIFADGSVVPLPEGSVEGRRAQYLARRVLEAGRRS